MPRLSQRCLLSDLAVAILVVFAAVSIADIDDYGAHTDACLSSPFAGSASSDGIAEAFPSPADSESDSGHACSCLLCVTTLSSPFGPRVLPPSAGKLSNPGSAGLALSSHVSEVFHPPSA